VSSVVLGSGVVLYGTSLFQGNTQQESITASGIKMWVNSTDPNGNSWGAAKVRNTGDKLVAIDKIQIRGVDIPFTNWYVDTTVNSTTFQQSLNFTSFDGNLLELEPSICPGGEDVRIRLGDLADICATQGSGPIAMIPGAATVIYFHLVNGTITSLDAGVSTSVGIFAGKAGAPQSVTVEGR